jgi:hypothetical protein
MPTWPATVTVVGIMRGVLSMDALVFGDSGPIATDAD